MKSCKPYLIPTQLHLSFLNAVITFNSVQQTPDAMLLIHFGRRHPQFAQGKDFEFIEGDYSIIAPGF
jgi:hypothetical protein